MRIRLMLAVVLPVLVGSCSHSDPTPVVVLTSSPVRAERRAYDGAPPVIPHRPLGGACTTCHTAEARTTPGVGLAPPNPHTRTPGLSASARCQQCHVFQMTSEVFRESDFHGFVQDLRHGERMYAHAPPVIPHGDFLREDCAAFHTGIAARAEVKCTHPERTDCKQCHARSGQ
jgi:cytochrome c-type protein NapB